MVWAGPWSGGVWWGCALTGGAFAVANGRCSRGMTWELSLAGGFGQVLRRRLSLVVVRDWTIHFLF